MEEDDQGGGRVKGRGDGVLMQRGVGGVGDEVRVGKRGWCEEGKKRI